MRQTRAVYPNTDTVNRFPLLFTHFTCIHRTSGSVFVARHVCALEIRVTGAQT